MNIIFRRGLKGLLYIYLSFFYILISFLFLFSAQALRSATRRTLLFRGLTERTRSLHQQLAAGNLRAEAPADRRDPSMLYARQLSFKSSSARVSASTRAYHLPKTDTTSWMRITNDRLVPLEITAELTQSHSRRRHPQESLLMRRVLPQDRCQRHTRRPFGIPGFMVTKFNPVHACHPRMSRGDSYHSPPLNLAETRVRPRGAW